MRTQGSLAEQDFPRLVQALHRTEYDVRWLGDYTAPRAKPKTE